MIFPLTKSPKEKENKSRLPIKKRKLRGNFDLTCNEDRLLKVSIHQPAMDPTSGPSLINASTIETIAQDFNEIVTSDVVKAKRRKLLTKTKTFWSTKLGMSKVQFCNGLWRLARNKANARNQFDVGYSLQSLMILDQIRDTADAQCSVLTDATNSILVNSSTTPNKSGEGDVNVPGIHQIVDPKLPWSKVLHSGIQSIGTFCMMWG
ncbi:MAG: hypothetical protein SGBAC_006076 [Bacillariaceae sp.]